MKERPIIFSGEMVRAIIDGRKTMTRRVMKPQPVPIGKHWEWRIGKGSYYVPRGTQDDDLLGIWDVCPHGKPGDSLWVRETWATNYAGPDALTRYRADGEPSRRERERDSLTPWRSPIYMHRWASRLTLEITGIRVERVQDISEQDAVAEGLDARPQRARDWYGELWDSINAKRGHGWATNPWVWVIEFKRVAP